MGLAAAHGAPPPLPGAKYLKGTPWSCVPAGGRPPAPGAAPPSPGASAACVPRPCDQGETWPAERWARQGGDTCRRSQAGWWGDGHRSAPLLLPAAAARPPSRRSAPGQTPQPPLPPHSLVVVWAVARVPDVIMEAPKVNVLPGHRVDRQASAVLALIGIAAADAEGGRDGELRRRQRSVCVAARGGGGRLTRAQLAAVIDMRGQHAIMCRPRPILHRRDCSSHSLVEGEEWRRRELADGASRPAGLFRPPLPPGDEEDAGGVALVKHQALCQAGPEGQV